MEHILGGGQAYGTAEKAIERRPAIPTMIENLDRSLNESWETVTRLESRLGTILRSDNQAGVGGASSPTPTPLSVVGQLEGMVKGVQMLNSRLNLIISRLEV